MFEHKWFFFSKDEGGCGCGCSCNGDDAASKVDGCGCGDDCDCGCEDETDPVIEIVDPETNEKFSFYYSDEFEFKEEVYCVLVTLDEDDPHYVIARVIEGEDGEDYIETLDEENSDEIYEEYERLLEEEFDEEGDGKDE